MDFTEEIKKAPQRPGVYIFRDKGDVVIYVGKAVNLRNRLRSYFQASSVGEGFDGRKVMSIRAVARSFEIIVTDTEFEALVLECNLIKEHMPRYNVLLKDDKGFPYICLTLGEEYPRIVLARRAARDGHRYFGPYVSGHFVREVVDLARQIWPLRRCGQKTGARPCLNYHIGKCPAPCGGHIDKDAYGELAAQVKEFLGGKRQSVIRRLEQEMAELSAALEFEKAAAVRDKLVALERLDEKQSTERISSGDHDVVAMARGDDEVMIQVFFIRDGKMTGREHFLMTGVMDNDDGVVMQAFLTQFYSGVPQIPKELDLEVAPAERAATEEWLRAAAGRKVALIVPERGDKRRLVKLAKENAQITLAQFGEQIKRERERTRGAAAELAEILGVSKLTRIEAFDISNVQGYESVASMTVFEDGKPKRSDYRKFRLKSVIGANDYAAMEEVLTRRFSRYIAEHSAGDAPDAPDTAKFSALPDIIMVDGGKGQVGVAQKVLASFNLSVPVCGMVKDERHRTRGIIFNNTEINPPKHSEGFKFLTRIQDETHRFAVEYHRKLREKRMLRSALDDIPGIGPQRRKALLRFFGSIEGIEGASMDDLLKVDKINKRAAEAVYGFFRQQEHLQEN